MITATRTASKQASAGDSVVGCFLRSRTQENRDRVVDHYHSIVTAMVSRIGRCAYRRVVDQDDLLQIGLMALVSAVETYDPSRSSFRTYAHHRVRYAILDELRATGVPVWWRENGHDQLPLEEEPASRALVRDEAGFAEMLESCRGHLTEQQVCVLVCHYYEGMSLSNIRGVLGMKVADLSELHQSALDAVASVLN